MLVNHEGLFTELWRCRGVAKINQIFLFFKHQAVNYKVKLQQSKGLNRKTKYCTVRNGQLKYDRKRSLQ